MSTALSVDPLNAAQFRDRIRQQYINLITENDVFQDLISRAIDHTKRKQKKVELWSEAVMRIIPYGKIHICIFLHSFSGLDEINILLRFSFKKERTDPVNLRNEINALCRGFSRVAICAFKAYIKGSERLP